MCLILFALDAHPQLGLIIAANRDEYYRRPTARAAFWDDHPDVLAGRDLECMGTWLGVTRQGRIAALTNFRDPRERKTQAPSRGELVSGFLTGDAAPADYLDEIAQVADRYNGFNLLAGDLDGFYYLSSRSATVSKVASGIHGLSNHLLDTPWPKVERGKQRLQSAIEEGPSADRLLDLLYDSEPARIDELPDTGVGAELEKVLSPALIVSPLYGTRASTAILIGRDGYISFSERTILSGGTAGATVSLRFRLEP